LDVPAAKQRTYEIYLDLIPSQLKPFPGVIELLHRCREAGLLIAVASSADMVKVRANLATIRVPVESWDAVVTGEDVTNKKPAPDIFLSAAAKLGVKPEECVVVEDAVNGVQAAKSAGMRCVAVATSFPAARLQEADLVRAATADVTLSDLAPHWGSG
jgi:HAD superfamily hydrolase (TIGR01509 family)